VSALSETQGVAEVLRANYTTCSGQLQSCEAEERHLALTIQPAYSTTVAVLCLWILVCAVWDYCHNHPYQFPGNR